MKILFLFLLLFTSSSSNSWITEVEATIAKINSEAVLKKKKVITDKGVAVAVRKKYQIDDYIKLEVLTT